MKPNEEDPREVALHCHHVDVFYGQGARRNHAVRDVSFQVYRGETFGLVGGSGCGKSTILRMLAGLDGDWRGEVAVLGQARSAREKPPAAYRLQVQMIFQDPFGSLHPRHTIDRSLSEAMHVHGFDRIEQRVLAALDRVGLGRSFRFRFPHQLSGGQRQRVAIARALVLEPQILLLDEPTSSLDASIQAEVLNLLMDVRRDLGTTFLFVSHDLGVIAHMCERVAVMQQGAIVETLPAARITSGDVAHPYTRELLANCFPHHAAPVGLETP
ncbi:MAG: ABC transporter ATP-binding protein [Rhodoferax sp.]|jgi:peptide/nickel transport system ATP-binding protein|nr:ABC transporter ATP-binding protein [Rhodoferax sp.]